MKAFITLLGAALGFALVALMALMSTFAEASEQRHPVEVCYESYEPVLAQYLTENGVQRFTLEIVKGDNLERTAQELNIGSLWKVIVQAETVMMNKRFMFYCATDIDNVSWAWGQSIPDAVKLLGEVQ